MHWKSSVAPAPRCWHWESWEFPGGDNCSIGEKRNCYTQLNLWGSASLKNLQGHFFWAVCLKTGHTPGQGLNSAEFLLAVHENRKMWDLCRAPPDTSFLKFLRMSLPSDSHPALYDLTIGSPRPHFSPCSSLKMPHETGLKLFRKFKLCDTDWFPPGLITLLQKEAGLNQFALSVRNSHCYSLSPLSCLDNNFLVYLLELNS